MFFIPIFLDKKFVQPCAILRTKWISVMLGNPVKILSGVLHTQSSEMRVQKNRHKTALAEFCAECICTLQRA